MKKGHRLRLRDLLKPVPSKERENEVPLVEEEVDKVILIENLRTDLTEQLVNLQNVKENQ